ncbi:Gfo/Idh/MocA family oxidoreductase [Accumulibacter sp.]|uniref:Gfo/Idh/MocA family protein n=1 Tax=Accumulibacter sp. TaxID=2053492 RepID=UPI0028C45F87|nr:Gfo/Idh/MocA family oxidoreductase [Accumulibacter sp.]
MNKIRKVIRFGQIYGVRKTLFKVLGRLRSVRLGLRPRRGANVGVVGTGQYAFATIGFALWKSFGNRFVAAYDIDESNAKSFCAFYGLGAPMKSAADLISCPDVEYIYIASNHASHTDYALQVLSAGKIPYIEKPISVDYEQFRRLLDGVRQSGLPVFAGYNRPFSEAIRLLKGYSGLSCLPITLCCFITGHCLESDHWYRKAEEGTRICGNVGHWLDLAVNILSWGVLADSWRISLAFGNSKMRDEDIAISLTSDRGDLVNIVLTARSEPFEGINETINFQQGSVIAKIDDFRSMTVWRGEKVKRHRFYPKDVGHNLGIIQPFSGVHRNWQEVEFSTLLMLFIKDMVIAGESVGEFSFSAAWDDLWLESLEARSSTA